MIVFNLAQSRLYLNYSTRIMNVVFKQISQSEYQSRDIPVLFGDEMFDRCFGTISDYTGEIYRLGWRSELLKPDLYMVGDRAFCVGIDQDFAIVGLADKKVYLYLKLAYFFYQVRQFKNFIFVITELGILLIDMMVYKVVRKYGLPDIFRSMSIRDNGDMMVRCLDGNCLSFRWNLVHN